MTEIKEPPGAVDILYVGLLRKTAAPLLMSSRNLLAKSRRPPVGKRLQGSDHKKRHSPYAPRTAGI